MTINQPITRESIEFGGRTLTIETGKLAWQAGGAVTVQYGDTMVLATATASKEPRPNVDFFPLTVDYEEKMYAAGKIPGGFIKRESRPSTEAILVSRLTDRPLRPLFPKGFRHDVQVVVTTLSVDQVNDPDILSIIGASTALTISDIPFNGPVGACRMGLIDGRLVVNPTLEQLPDSTLDLIMSATRDAVVMVEAGAKQVSESVINEALQRGHEAIIPLLDLQERLRQQAGKQKREFPLKTAPEGLVQAIQEFVGPRLHDHLVQPTKQQRQGEIERIEDEVLAHFEVQGWDPGDVKDAFGSVEKKTVREMILQENVRPDGRSRTEIRPLSVEVGVIPRVHGSGLFSRGQTQALTVATLGSPDKEQMIDGLGVNESKRYMHHYNFPSFSTGETKPMRGPGRREIGHGMLAERALGAVLPSQEDFPYTIRLVSEILSSNGSTSMAATTGSTLALMDAGVPITAPVSGIAMGLITGKDGKYAILTDIQGIEDNLGDMDFKVTGTREGVTAIQMDIKVSGLTKEIMEQALGQARDARLIILEKMLQVIPEPRKTLSPFAPRITRIQINPEKIGTVIGPGGKMIKKIIEETKASIDIEDDGTVYVGSSNSDGAEKAINMIRSLTEEVEVGKTYRGTVKRIMDFGAFVEILPNKEGLVHISQLENHRVNRVEDVVNLGDQIDVKVTEIDSMGRINLSRRALLEPVGGNGHGDESREPRRDFRGGGGQGGRTGFQGDRRPEGAPRGEGGQRREGGFRRDQPSGGRPYRDGGGEGRREPSGEPRREPTSDREPQQ